MPLKTTALETALKSAFDNGLKEFQNTMQSGGSVPSIIVQARAAGAAKFASEAAPALEAFVKSATVKAITIPPGQAVATAGSPAAQVGATTAPVQSLPLPSGLE